MIFRLFFAILLLFCSAGRARAEYILRLPNFSDIRFEQADVVNIKLPFIASPRQNEKELEQALDATWSVIRPKEKVLVEVDIQHYSPDSAGRDHKMIFYTTHAGVLAINGKEIIFPYSQIMIDKAYLGFMESYRRCFRDITPQSWPPDEPRLYASIRVKIRGLLDRIETDEPFLWEGRVNSVRFIDVYLRDIKILKIDCR